MSKDQAARIAEKIAKDLFTVGSINKRFTHLRASNYNPDTEEFDGLGCGWSEACAADLIAKHIRKARTKSTSRAVRKERARCVGCIMPDRERYFLDRTIRVAPHLVCDEIIEKINGGKR